MKFLRTEPFDLDFYHYQITPGVRRDVEDRINEDRFSVRAKREGSTRNAGDYHERAEEPMGECQPSLAVHRALFTKTCSLELGWVKALV